MFLTNLPFLLNPHPTERSYVIFLNIKKKSHAKQSMFENHLKSFVDAKEMVKSNSEFSIKYPC